MYLYLHEGARFLPESELLPSHLFYPDGGSVGGGEEGMEKREVNVCANPRKGFMYLGHTVAATVIYKLHRVIFLIHFEFVLTILF